jgi:hypothetical protein
MVRDFAEGPMAEQSTEQEPTRDPNQVRTLTEVSQRTSLSIDSLKRNYGDLIRRLSPRRLGMTERNIRKIVGE